MKKVIITTVISGLILFGLAAYIAMASQDNLPGVNSLLISDPAISAHHLHSLTIDQQDVERTYGEELPSTVTVGISDLDTDGDGIFDWIEVLMGTSPTDANDIPDPGSHYVYDDLGRLVRIVRITAGNPL